jgi:hypothetical protein
MPHTLTLKFLLSSILAIAFLLCVSVPAQQNQLSPFLNIAKGKFVVLKIPGKLVGFEKVSWWSGDFSYGSIIEQSEKTGITVGGVSDWRTSGWPLIRQLTLEKVSREKNFTLVELRDPLFNVKLRFDNSVKDLNAAFREVAFVGLLSEFETSDYYQQEVISKILPKVFTGGSASIQTTRKLNLLKELRYVDSAIRAEKYKGSTYLTIDVGGDTQIYNTIRVDQDRRIGDSLNQRVLFYFKRIARIVNFHPDVDGIKISIFVPYKNFVTEAYSQPNYDRVEIYAAMDVIQQFTDDELDNQEFVDEAILLVNGNRARSPKIKSL